MLHSVRNDDIAYKSCTLHYFPEEEFDTQTELGFGKLNVELASHKKFPTKKPETIAPVVISIYIVITRLC